MTLSGVIQAPIETPNRLGTEYQVGGATIESITSGTPLLIIRWSVPDSYQALSSAAKAYGRLATTDVDIVASHEGKTIKDTLPASDLERALNERLSPDFEFLTARTPSCALYIQGPGHETGNREIAINVYQQSPGMPETIAGLYHATMRSNREPIAALLSRVGAETFGQR